MDGMEGSPDLQQYGNVYVIHLVGNVLLLACSLERRGQSDFATPLQLTRALTSDPGRR